MNLRSLKLSTRITDGDREEIVGGVGCRSLGHERHKLRWDYYGQQAAYVLLRLCFQLWSVSDLI